MSRRSKRFVGRNEPAEENWFVMSDKQAHSDMEQLFFWRNGNLFSIAVMAGERHCALRMMGNGLGNGLGNV